MRYHRPVSAFRRPYSWLIFAALLGIVLLYGAYLFESTNQRLRTSIRNDRALPEALIADRVPSFNEATTLQRVLATYRSGGDAENVAAISDYLVQQPDSPWRVSLLTNLGLVYYRTGYFSKAIAMWDQAWKDGKASGDPEQRAIAEHAFGELVRMHARLGHAREVEKLLAELGERKLIGGASEAVAGAREGLWTMKNNPGIAYLCGPMALKSLLGLGQPNRETMSIVSSIRSGENGVSLSELDSYASKLDMPLRMAFRESNNISIPVPSVIHWKLNHYAAIVEKSGELYRIKDPTFGRDLWLSSAALNAESSGYFMIPKKQLREGWRDVGLTEAGSIRGMGYTNSLDPDPTRPHDPKECGGGCTPTGADAKGMARYAVHSMLVSLNIEDIPLGYAPPKGPEIRFHLTYNQREANQPANFNFSNVGQKWTHNWLSYVTDSPSQPGTDVSLAVLGGGTERYSGYESSTGMFAPESSQGARLVRIVGADQFISYERRFADGAVHIYRTPDNAFSFPRRVFLTEIRDPAGNPVMLGYDTQFRITGVIDTLGQATVFDYGDLVQPLRITKVTDPFGRHASLTYDAMNRLESITDVIGMTSEFEYDDGTFINIMTTPYGATNFVYSDISGTSRWIEITDPLGFAERVETRHSAPGIPFSETTVPTGIGVFNSHIDGRNTYYWDKDAFAIGSGDYTKGRIKHWLHDRDNHFATTSVLESIKMPLENRIWFNYPQQQRNPGETHYAFTGTMDKPITTARVLPDGTTQLSKAEYNQIGRITKKIDPLGREVIYEYAANGIDLLRVRRRTATDFDLLATYDNYNTLHQPQSYTDAAGKRTTYRYNAAGQITSVRDPSAGRLVLWTQSYVYDTNGYLKIVRNANNAIEQAYTYDAFGRVASVTDSEGHRREFEYDALDRMTRVVYPDATYEQYTYDKLDRTRVRDRLGRVTVFTYNAIRQLEQVDEPLPRTVLYEWTPAGRLSKLTDGEGRDTRWEYDIQGRKSDEIHADDSRTTYSYDSAGRLNTIQDALGQIKTYTYTRDDLLAGIGYADAIHPTAPVGFAYDPVYPRRTAMNDGLGTTLYTYKPVGALGALQVAQEDGPYSNDAIAYDYDALGRLTRRSINGQAQTNTFDAIGRLSARTNALGYFEYDYLGQSDQVQSRNAGLGPVLFYGYDDNLHDRVLRSIGYYEEQGSSGVLVPVQEYRYQRNTIGHITRIDEIPDGQEIQAKRWNVGYDDIDRLRTFTPLASESIYEYNYDRADNRPSANLDGVAQTATHNALNQLNALNAQPYQYDLNGNLLDDGTHQYQWDAENRLIKVISNASAGKQSIFGYDGLGRRLLIQDTPAAGRPMVERRYAWCDQQPCQERDAQDALLTLYFEEGELQQGNKVFYLRDQLGSVRQLQDLTSFTNGSYDYGPYGEAQASYGPVTSRYRYAGMFHHPATGLYLTWYRPYQPQIGRWLARDPTGISGGINLYAYVEGSPLNAIDPLGLQAFPLFLPRPIPLLLPRTMPRPIPAPLDPAMPFPLPDESSSALPKTDNCKASEWSICDSRCAPGQTFGCYVNIKWKIRGIRGGEPIRSEERTVNCNCEDMLACL